MINIVLFGPPGSGKGTQAQQLVDRFGLVQCSTGDLFRYNIKNETELGKLAKSFMDKGDLVPDEVTNNMLKDFVLRNKDVKGFIFDGYPRTTQQAEVLDEFLENTLNDEVKICVSLIVDDQILAERLLERGKSSGRPDDANINIIKNRIKEYYDKTNIVAEFYKKQSKFVEIEGVGEIKQITEKLSKEIEKIL